MAKILTPDAFRPRSEKAAGFPLVIESTEDEIGTGGFCYEPQRCEVLIGARHYDLSRGLIVVTSDSATAHEWRHHWQYTRGVDYDGLGWPPARPYREDIVRYFSRSRCEADALAYELRVYPCDDALLWLEWLAEAGLW